MVCRVYSVIGNYYFLLWGLLKNLWKIIPAIVYYHFQFHSSTFTVCASIYRSKKTYTSLLLGCEDRYIFPWCCWQLSCVIKYFGYVHQVPGMYVP